MNALPEFTADQFWDDRQEALEWLYNQRGTPAHERYYQRMQVLAKGLKIPNFVSLYKAYCKSRDAVDGGIYLDSYTSFTNQPIDLKCKGYDCNDDGVMLTDRYGYTTCVCPHPILPVRRLVNVDGGGERLDLAFRKGFVWRNTIQEKATIASSTQILKLANEGIVVNSENAKALSTYLLWIENENYDTIPEAKSVGRLGWIKNHGFSPYVEGLQFDGEGAFGHLFNSVHQEGSFDVWLDAVRAVRAERTPARFFLAASFASVLIEPTNQLPFFVHAYGKSGTGKTVGLMMAASVWANPDSSAGFLSTFNSTSVAQELRASFLNSLPMCIDELQIQAAQGVTDFDKIIYTLTEGIPKGRGTKEGGLKNQNGWKNCMITSGEQPISHSSSGGGAINRIIEFECDKKIYEDVDSLPPIFRQNYGHAGKMFIEWLQDENNMRRAIETQKAYYRSLLNAGGTDKQAASAAVLLTADELTNEIFFRDNNGLTSDEIISVMKSAETVDAGKRAMDYITDFVNANRARFYPLRDGDREVNMCGKIDGGVVQFFSSALDEILRKEGFERSTLLSYAKRKDLLLCDKDNRLTKLIRINGGLSRCICIKINDVIGSQDVTAETDPLPPGW